MKLNFYKRNSNEKISIPFLNKMMRRKKNARVEDSPKFIITVWPEHLTAE